MGPDEVSKALDAAITQRQQQEEKYSATNSMDGVSQRMAGQIFNKVGVEIGDFATIANKQPPALVSWNQRLQTGPFAIQGPEPQQPGGPV